MGMFDTIQLKSPLVCPSCGAEERSLQTHAFDDSMSTYKIGSLVRGSSVLSGIIKESFWCSACYKAGGSSDSPVYLVIWNSILAGVEQDLARAEARLGSVDRLDLIAWLDEAQRETGKWRRQFYGLSNDLQRWHDHLVRQQNPEPEPEGQTTEQAKRRKAFAGLWGPAEEILSAADPLAVILERNKPGAADDSGDDGW